jgi:hypothetical protein
LAWLAVLNRLFEIVNQLCKERVTLLHHHIEAATNCRTVAQIFNEWLLFCGGDVASQSNCCRKRQHTPLSESNAHHCDTCATPRMSRAHGTYAASRMAYAAKRAYVSNQQQ